MCTVIHYKSSFLIDAQGIAPAEKKYDPSTYTYVLGSYFFSSGSIFLNLSPGLWEYVFTKINN